MNSCCEKPNVVNDVCENCCSLSGEIVFEDGYELSYRITSKARINKFKEFIFNKLISNFCRVTLLDLFPMVERAFFDSDRKNFVNLNQLVRELLPFIGYEEYIDLFPPLKTKSRCLQIRKMVQRCFKDGGSVPVVRLEDLWYLEPRVGNVDMSKVMRDHDYTDRYNINDETSCSKTQA